VPKQFLRHSNRKEQSDKREPPRHALWAVLEFDLRENAPPPAKARANANPNMAIMLIGNKCDLERREAAASDPKDLRSLPKSLSLSLCVACHIAFHRGFPAGTIR